VLAVGAAGRAGRYPRLVDLSVFFAGTGASAPSARRGLSATLLRAGGDRLLIDCGEGTQRQLIRSVGLVDLDAIFLTHLHADHWFGLPGMLKSYDMRDRDRPIELFGPRGTKALIASMKPVFGRLNYELTIEEVEPGESLRFDEYRMQTYATRHRGPAVGWVFLEDDRPGRFDVDRARELGVTEGPDFGRLQRGESVDGIDSSQVVGPGRRGRRVVFTGDTRPTDATVVAATGADLLVHEATFVDEDKARAAETGHSTGRQAAQIAADAGVHMLALNHVASRVFVGELEQQVHEVFPSAIIARDFDEIEIPMPDRGPPVHTRWRDRPARVAEGEAAAGAAPLTETRTERQNPVPAEATQ
jgi:ribonuclease Z